MEEKKYGVWAVRSSASMFGAAETWCKADGVPNNLPPAKADLTDGQTYDEIMELAPETLPEEKPSVLERLKADIPRPEEHELAVTPPEWER